MHRTIATGPRPFAASSLLALGCVLALAVSAAAHPLGNFTINHYSRLSFADNQVRVTYVLDMAEIPTFQQAADLDPDGDGALSDEEKRRYLETIVPRLASNLDLRIGGERVPLSAVEQDALYKPGVGGLKVLRIESVLTGALPSGWEANGSATYTNRNYEDRLGWREIVVRGGPDVAILRSTAPTSDVSNELRAYPEDSLATPLDHREASFTLTSGYGGPAEDTAGLAAANVRAGDSRASTSKVAALISPGELTPRVMLVALLAALLWGAAHALTPGHGKTVVAAYLIGTRGAARHAVFLGLTVTLTHTLGVFALGGATLYLSRYILPEQLYPWLSVVSGLMVVVIGGTLLVRRTRAALSTSAHQPHDHAPDSHTGAHGHSHSLHSHDRNDLASSLATGSGQPDHNLAHGHDLDRITHFENAAHGLHEHAADHSHALVGDDHAHEHGDPDHPHTHHHGDHTHTHDGSTHSHLPPGADGSKVTIKSLVALGVSGGLVTCPSALVLLLSAISLGRLGFGLVLVITFSLGLAGVLTGIGLVLVYARRWFERYSFEMRAPRYLPVASALAISIIGLLIVVDALRQTGLGG